MDKSSDRRAALKMIEAHGENAARKAEERAQRLVESGDEAVAATWAEIGRQIRMMQAKPPS